MADCIGIRCVGWLNEMCVGRCGRRCDIIDAVILKPVALVYGIIPPIGWVAYVEFEKVPSILHAQRIQ